MGSVVWIPPSSPEAEEDRVWTALVFAASLAGATLVRQRQNLEPTEPNAEEMHLADGTGWYGEKPISDKLGAEGCSWRVRAAWGRVSRDRCAKSACSQEQTVSAPAAEAEEAVYASRRYRRVEPPAFL